MRVKNHQTPPTIRPESDLWGRKKRKRDREKETKQKEKAFNSREVT